MKPNHVMPFFIFSALILGALICQGQTRYNVTDVGTFGGNTYPVSINSAGDVVGNSTTADGSAHAFLWTASGGLQDLGTLGGTASSATAINASQEIIGRATTIDGFYHNFFWFPDTGMTAFGNDGLVGVNSSGQVVGVAIGTDSQFHSFIWTASTGKTDLGLAKGQKSSEATAINDLGQVVGVAGNGQGFFWSKATGNILVPGTSYFTSIDNQGAAAGFIYVGYFQPHAILWSNASGVTDLGTLGGGSTDSSEAFGISDNGQVVGYSTNSTGLGGAFVYSKATGMLNLNTLENGNWFLSLAYGINSSGQIIAWGSASGSNTAHALLLTPQ
jgi:probable HAF family extracellular repeat protein